MNSTTISLIIGYFMIVNIIGISLIWINVKTNFIKLSKRNMNIIYTFLALIGGFVGILVGAEMMNYEQDNKLFKRWIPFFIFIEACIALYFVYQNIA